MFMRVCRSLRDYVLRDTKISSTSSSLLIWINVSSVCDRHKCDRATARKLINNGEDDRASYYNYYTGKKWGHSASGDLCVNSSVLVLKKRLNMATEFIKRKFK